MACNGVLTSPERSIVWGAPGTVRESTTPLTLAFTELNVCCPNKLMTIPVTVKEIAACFQCVFIVSPCGPIFICAERQSDTFYPRHAKAAKNLRGFQNLGGFNTINPGPTCPPPQNGYGKSYHQSAFERGSIYMPTSRTATVIVTPMAVPSGWSLRSAGRRMVLRLPSAVSCAR